VRRALAATGKVRVTMTRDRDVFVSLKRRVAIAEAARADLFLSFHADALKDHRVSGGSVYTLSEKASDTLAAELAVSENKADIIAGVDLSDHSAVVSNILIDLARRGTMEVSAEIARVLVRELKGATRMLPTSRRFAGFAVLKGADVPSLLIELGFISNRRDERLLRQRDHQVRLARAVTQAVDDWFESNRD
jgi:N-acetylmuramoyl-L-alanine amidase